MTKLRTCFAPSSTGFIHLSNIRSALYPWAFAKASDGDFILRIEDTDQERSTQAAVDVILESMAWLGMTPDEGPFYQMQCMQRYKEVIAQMQAAGLVYPCYMSVAELDALREHTHGLTGAVRQRHGTTHQLIDLAGINAQANGNINGGIEILRRGVLDQLGGLQRGIQPTLVQLLYQCLIGF